MENIDYKIAEFMVYNHEALKSDPTLALAYSKALSLSREEARELILECLAYVLSHYFDPMEVAEAFESDKVQIILHKYFVKEWEYEH